MPDVKRNRGNPARLHVYLSIGKTPAPLKQIFIGQLQRVQNRACDGGNICLGAA